jgi:hypothetical protein
VGSLTLSLLLILILIFLCGVILNEVKAPYPAQISTAARSTRPPIDFYPKSSSRFSAFFAFAFGACLYVTSSSRGNSISLPARISLAEELLCLAQHFLRRLQLTFPYNQHAPTKSPELPSDELVAFNIASELRNPKAGSGTGRLAARAGAMLMPEAAMNEYHSFPSREYQVRFTRKQRRVKAVTISCFVKQRPISVPRRQCLPLPLHLPLFLRCHPEQREGPQRRTSLHCGPESPDGEMIVSVICSPSPNEGPAISTSPALLSFSFDCDGITFTPIQATSRTDYLILSARVQVSDNSATAQSASASTYHLVIRTIQNDSDAPSISQSRCEQMSRKLNNEAIQFRSLFIGQNGVSSADWPRYSASRVHRALLSRRFSVRLR